MPKPRNHKSASDAPIANSLLAALPRTEYRRLLAGLEPVTLTFGDVLHEPGKPIRYVYFPLDCVVSLVTVVRGRQAVEVALVGHEGMVGSPLVLGIHTSSRRAVVTTTGIAMRMESALFLKAVAQSNSLRQALFRYKHVLIGQIAQSVACKQFHSVQERLSRYLLMIGDRTRSEEMHLTHEFLARMLGVQRAAVTVAACDLQERKLIKYVHGRITIVNRKRLTSTCCECYEIIKRIYEHRTPANS